MPKARQIQLKLEVNTVVLTRSSCSYFILYLTSKSIFIFLKILLKKCQGMWKELDTEKVQQTFITQNYCI